LDHSCNKRGVILPLTSKYLEGTREGRNGGQGVEGLRGYKKSQKNLSKSKRMHPHPMQKI